MKNQNLCQNEIEALKVTKESFTQELYLLCKGRF